MKQLFVFADMKTKSKVLLGVLSPMVLLLLLGGIAIYNINSITKTNKWVDHTHNVLAKASTIIASAVDMETGMRGYLLAGKEEFLDPYKGGEKAVYAGIADLQKTVSDNPKQVARLGEVEKTLKAWQKDVTSPTINLRRQIGDAKTMNDMAALVGEAKGKVFFDKFRGQIGTFINREATLLNKRRAEFETAQKSVSEQVGLMAKRQESTEAAWKSVDSKLKIMKDNEGWVSHTYKVIGQANGILAAAVDMETGMRGYLLAGQEEFLDPYKSGSKKFYREIAKLRETVSDKPPQVKLLTETEATIREWQEKVTEPTIDLRRQIGNAKTMDDMADLVGQAKGKVYFDGFRKLMAEFSGEEKGLMDVRKANNLESVSNTYIMISVCIGLGLIIGLVLAWVIGNGIANPIKNITETMGKLADGDKTVEIPGIGRADEIGSMADAVEVFKRNALEADSLREEQKLSEKRALEERRDAMHKLADQFEQSVGGVVENVSSASTEMEASAQQMTNTADQTSERASDVASASEQASNNVQTVAAAAEELSASIGEISRQVQESTNIATNAVNESNSAHEMVQSLAKSASTIGDVVGLITDIAEQTNLLALNATIEAARAGDAGKGFAVVASEVKNLANQTAKATEEISTQIDGIQSASQNAVEAIERIGKTIGDLSEIATTIASAVEEQGAATQEIARNVEQASSGTSQVNTNITGVSQAAKETGQTASNILGASGELSKQSVVLKDEVSQFLSQVRAG